MQKYSRYQYIAIVNKSLQVQQNYFASEVSLFWLSNFPGDLYMSMLYAKSLIKTGKPGLAIPILEGLCIADPEFVEAIQLLVNQKQGVNKYYKAKSGTATLEHDVFPYNCIPTWLYSLSGPRMFGDGSIPKSELADINDWGHPLRQARNLIQDVDNSKVEKLILLALGMDPHTPIIQATHLKYLNSSSDISLQGKINIAEHYHKLWPNCLTITLFLAHWLTISYNSDQGVDLIHQVISRDVGGQIPKRIWDIDNPYKELWPTDLNLNLPHPIPQQVSAHLDWYQLPAKVIYPPLKETTSIGSKPSLPDFLISAKALSDLKQSKNQDNEKVYTKGKPKKKIVNNDELTKSFNEELEKIAKGINLSGITEFDGRYPIYVILSSRKNLLRKYGSKITEQIIDETKAIVNQFNENSITISGKLWGGRLYLPDDDMLMNQLDMEAITECSPWKIKLALMDLDEYLSLHGEMIGAVLIIGGHDIIPFHYLPNPIDDPDDYVASDNPYGTRDENYFFLEWPVGRLPDGRGTDPNLLIKSIQNICRHYKNHTNVNDWRRNWKNKFLKFPKPFERRTKHNFGYSAEVWIKASQLVYQPIGKSKDIYTSPPIGTFPTNPKNDSLPLANANLGYFNLHGLVDSADWYGQSDTFTETSEPDFPIALSPTNIGHNGYHKQKFSFLGKKPNQRESSVPVIIFSEACYGAHTLDKSIEEAISLKFLSTGTKSYVGSTSMSYGSLYGPLIAADLLGNAFWHYIEMGYAVGEALRLSKHYLTKEMTSRQGYLDGEDQKTLISFILFGDPLYVDKKKYKQMKGISRIRNHNHEFMTVCDRITKSDIGSPINSEESEYIKKIVAQYLPGMINADFCCSNEKAVCHAEDHSCPTRQLNVNEDLNNKPKRKVVTLKKSTHSSEHDHSQFARLTLNENGELVKLVISR